MKASFTLDEITTLIRQTKRFERAARNQLAAMVGGPEPDWKREGLEECITDAIAAREDYRQFRRELLRCDDCRERRTDPATACRCERLDEARAIDQFLSPSGDE